MKSGKLRYFVHVVRRRPGQDEVGQPDIVFDPLFDTWADIKPVIGKEFFAAGTMVANVDTTIDMRFIEETKGITAADRVIVDGPQGGSYDVQAVLPALTMLQVMARRVT